VDVSLPRSSTPEGQAGLDAILAAPATALIASDFDGTLSPIVPNPADARAYPGATDSLARLATLAGTVAIITGRPAADAVELGGLASVPGLIVLGHYGAERWQGGTVTTTRAPNGAAEAGRLLPAVLAEAGAPDGVRIEDKGTAVGVHTRQTSDPLGTLDLLRAPLEDLARRTGLTVEPGRYVLELRQPGIDKGAALRGLAAERGAKSVLFCGDDLGDLAAFAAVRTMRAEGIPGCTVASASPEAQPVADDADLVVDGPPGIVAFLTAIATSAAA
jgi:trehalose 6-phosphate phosphatase